MKLTKTQWIIVAVVAGVAIWYFFLRKKDGDKKETGYLGLMGFSGSETGYTENDLGANINTETGYTNDDLGGGVESGYSIFPVFCPNGQVRVGNTCVGGRAGTGSSYTAGQVESNYEKAESRSINYTTERKSLQNTGQICKKDKQCGPGLICINGRCGQPISIPRPIAPIKTDIFPVFSPTTTVVSTPRGVTDTGSSTGTGVVSPTTSTGSVPRTLSGATGMTIEAGYMM